MVRPQTEAIAIDKRDVLFEGQCTGTFGELCSRVLARRDIVDKLSSPW